MVERPKPKREVDTEYLTWIRNQPSVVSGKSDIGSDGKPRTDPAHLISRGAGGSDYSAVPLTHEEHMELHLLGMQEFETRHKIDLWKEAWRLTVRHFTTTAPMKGVSVAGAGGRVTVRRS